MVSDPTSPIVQIFTFFPYTAPFTAMLRNGLGSLPGWQAAIVITELIVLGSLVLLLAVRIFRYGSIQYTSKVSLTSALGRRRHSPHQPNPRTRPAEPSALSAPPRALPAVMR